MHEDRYIETLRLIDDFHQRYTYSPSLKELADKLGITEGGCSFRLAKMEEFGWLERVANRALRVTEKGYGILEETPTPN